MTTLGTQKAKIVFVCQGWVNPEEMQSIVLQVIQAAGMTPARGPRVDIYPYLGRGGYGYTLYQPLMESYLIADIYSLVNETEVLISTCKPDRMDKVTITKILAREIGPVREAS